MAFNILQWTSSGTYSTLLTSSELTGLTTGSGVLGGTIQTNNKDQYAHVEIQMLSTGALASGDYLSVYWITAADNTNYEDGGASVTPARAADLIIPVRAVTNSSQRITMKNVPIPGGNFKVLLINQLSTKLDTTANILSFRPVNDQITTG